MGQQTSKSTTPTFDREVNSTEIRFNDPTLLQEPRPGFRVQSSGFRVHSSGFRVFSIHKQLTSLESNMLQEPPVCNHNRWSIDVHNSSSMTHHSLPSIKSPFHGIPFIFNDQQSTISTSSSTNNPFSSKHLTYSPEASLIVLLLDQPPFNSKKPPSSSLNVKPHFQQQSVQ